MTADSNSSARTGSFGAAPPDEPFPGVRRASLTSARATVSHYTFEPGAAFPRHRHAQEQITLIVAGSVEMAIGEDRGPLRAGDWSVVGPNVEHGIAAGGDGARIVAIVSPPRDSADEYELRTQGDR